MEQLTELKNAIVERFKWNAYAKALEKTIENHAEKLTFEKYKGTIILRGGLEYKLFAVNAITNSLSHHIKPDDLELTLIYTIISKIESHEKRALSKAMRKYESEGNMGFYHGKKRLVIKEIYVLDTELVMENQINLKIENKK